MKINFWSSTEYSGFMAGLMRELCSSGLDAKQRYQISESSYRSAKSPTARLFLRFRQYVVYPVQISLSLIWDLMSTIGDSKGQKSKIKNRELPQSMAVVSTNTFYAPLLATYLHPNVVHLVYDLFPEAMIHSGKWQEGKLKVKLVRWITKQTLRRAKTHVFLGRRLQEYVESIHGPVPNAVIIPVGADQALFVASPQQRLEHRTSNVEHRMVARGEQYADGEQGANNQPTILYCGNFGNMHESATLFECWRSAGYSTTQPLNRSTKVNWRFHCAGPKRAALEQVVADLPNVMKNQIHLDGGLSQEAWVSTMESADIALVTMAPGAEQVVMPSKTYSAMMAGQAILAIAPEDSDLVDTIKAADCGWWVAPGDVDGLAQVIDTICADAEGLLAKRENAYTYAHAQFGQDILAKKWIQLFDAPAVRDA